MSDQCQSIEDEIASIDKQIDLLENPPVRPPPGFDVGKQIALLRAERARLQRELEICLDPCRPIKDGIAAAQAQIQTLTTEIGGLTLQITQLNLQIAGLQTQVAQLQADIQQREQALLQCQQAHQ